jgi:hypothetical protein
MLESQRELGNQNGKVFGSAKKRMMNRLQMIAITIVSTMQGKEEFVTLVIRMTKSSESF